MVGLVILAGMPIVFWLSSAIAPAHSEQGASAPLREAPESSIGYPSVEAAQNALSKKTGIILTRENGWLIATDKANLTIWSFAPKSYPAYPAVVKRQVVAGAKGSSVTMKVQCESSKVACDDLVRTFSRMNGLGLPR
jgi:hypothetical protein